MVAACPIHQLPYGPTAVWRGNLTPAPRASYPPWTLLVDGFFNDTPWFGMLPNRNKWSAVEQGPWRAPHWTCPTTFIHIIYDINFTSVAFRLSSLVFRTWNSQKYQNSSNECLLYVSIYIYICYSIKLQTFKDIQLQFPSSSTNFQRALGAHYLVASAIGPYGLS